MCINQIIESAIEDGLIYKNVCRNINMPTSLKNEKRALTDIEKEAIVKADLTDKEKAFVYLIQYTGIRRGEALSLTTNDIDFENNQIIINKAVTFVKNTTVLKPMPKTAAGIRDIPMPDILKNFLESYNTESKYLFEMERKERLMNKSSYDKFWNKIVRKLNIAAGGTDNERVINNLGAHVFRHNYATMLFYAGVDIKEAQYLLGHTDVKLTLDIYTHLNRQNTDAASKLNQFLTC